MPLGRLNEVCQSGRRPQQRTACECQGPAALTTAIPVNLIRRRRIVDDHGRRQQGFTRRRNNGRIDGEKVFVFGGPLCGQAAGWVHTNARPPTCRLRRQYTFIRAVTAPCSSAYSSSSSFSVDPGVPCRLPPTEARTVPERTFTTTPHSLALQNSEEAPPEP